VLQQWGGYAGEPYGQGSELVVQFTLTGGDTGNQPVRRHGSQASVRDS
jgi:hypothetical protein